MHTVHDGYVYKCSLADQILTLYYNINPQFNKKGPNKITNYSCLSKVCSKTTVSILSRKWFNLFKRLHYYICVPFLKINIFRRSKWVFCWGYETERGINTLSVFVFSLDFLTSTKICILSHSAQLIYVQFLICIVYPLATTMLTGIWIVKIN